MAYLEHANITVPNVDEAVKFLQLVEPTFSIRHQGVGSDGIRWLHLGDDDHYFALRDAPEDTADERAVHDMYHVGINHLGVVVDDIAAVTTRVKSAGYHELGPGEDHPFRRRAYFLDGAGFEWEFIQYLSERPTERNAYD